MEKTTVYRRLRLNLHWKHREILMSLTSKGDYPARVVRRANVLLATARGSTAAATAEFLGCAPGTVRRIVARYACQGLEAALFDDPRPGAKPSIAEAEAQKIVAMLCGPVPMGRNRWSIRLAVEECKKGGLETITREPLRLLMKRHDLKPWRKKNVVRS